MAPWGLLNPRGPRTDTTVATAGRRSVLPCSPADFTPFPPHALWGLAEVDQRYPQGRWRVKGNVEYFGPVFLVVDPGGGTSGMPAGSPRYRGEDDLRGGSSDDLCQGEQDLG